MLTTRFRRAAATSARRRAGRREKPGTPVGHRPGRHRVLAVVLAAAALAAPATAQPDAGETVGDFREPVQDRTDRLAEQSGAGETAVDALRCWRRVSRNAVYVGERFTMTVTCRLVETDAARTRLDETALEPASLDAALGITHEGEGRDLVELVAEEPDLWDVNIANFEADARPSRFVKEAAQEPYVRFVKQVTSKPVVGVGRFTSPDTMLGQINRGVLDFIGAARPSIADPFLPRKIEEGRPEDVRECIGCNICIWSNHKGFPLRCTQNPTRGEEWRRGWHPEEIAARHADESVLVVGAGPAGLEAALSLGRRGYRVVLAEALAELGGRVTRESALPGLSEWARVRDHRVHALRQMPNVEIYRDSRLDAEQVLEFGFAHVCIATGSRWRRDGTGRSSPVAFAGWRSEGVV